MGLWVGRGHLKDVFNKALGRAPEVEDGDEIMSYRAAVLCLTGGVLVMIGWLWAMGATLWVAAVFIALSMLIFIGISRVVAEAGLAAVRSPMIAPTVGYLGHWHAVDRSGERVQPIHGVYLGGRYAIFLWRCWPAGSS